MPGGKHIYGNNEIKWPEYNGITTWPWIVEGKNTLEVILVLHSDIRDADEQYRRAVLFAALWNKENPQCRTRVRILFPGQEHTKDMVDITSEILKDIDMT
jgi:hypothetical protein